MNRVASVIVDVRTRQLDKSFDYVIPSELWDQVFVGSRVYLSFGRQLCQGFVERVFETEQSERVLKPILAALDDTPILTEGTFELIEWLCSRYACTRMDAISVILPGAFRIETVKRYRATGQDPIGSAALRKIWDSLKSRPKSMEQLLHQHGSLALVGVKQLLGQGAIEEIAEARDSVRPKIESYVEGVCQGEELKAWAESKVKRAPKQAEILSRLSTEERIHLRDLGLRPSDPAIQALVEMNLVRIVQVESYRDVQYQGIPTQDGPRELTRYQARALDEICSSLGHGESNPIVLFGVTGSGKTEVYMGAIAKCLQLGHGAIVLVPEISLTPQMVGRFTSRFGAQVAVLHSGLSVGEKRDEWVRIRRGEARIVVGARSAVFAPVQSLKLIIVDEEHEPSYKQDETPRYDAREVARWRKTQCQGTVVYGSATPSLEAYYHVEQGSAQLVTLPFRVHGRPLPPVEIVDMREELKSGNRGIFSRQLSQGLEHAVGSGHQAILFLNRRGYASFLLCRNCGQTLECPHCDIALTLHKGTAGQFAVCHYCEYQIPVHNECPHCKEQAMRPFGIGTQQVEQILQKEHPDWRILRMDVDTTRQKGAHRNLTEQFLRHEADVLIGTQMIAKGLDFPNVTFVGVIAADTMLSVPDYRSSERTFNLLTQVAGRAGRAEAPGMTVIQTFRPEHFSIQAAARHDYMGFYRRERELREAFHYPPFCEIAVFLATHHESRLSEGAAKRFERELRKHAIGLDMQILPAVPAGVARIDDKYRFQVVVKYSQWNVVRDVVVQAFQVVYEIMRKHQGTCILDVNAGRI